jgi:hypothetical protein
MRTAIKFRLFYVVQDIVLNFLVFRERVKRFMNPNPRSFWDL